jgi:cell division protein FtsL
MPKLVAGLLASAVMAVLFLTFQLSYKVQQTDDNITRLRHQLRQEQQALHVLGAEWAYINRPERLKALAEQYTGMQPATQSSLIAISAIPSSGSQAMAMLASYKPSARPRPAAPSPAMQADSFAAAPAPAQPAPQKLAMRSPDVTMRALKHAPATRRASVWDVLNATSTDGAE